MEDVLTLILLIVGGYLLIQTIQQTTFGAFDDAGDLVTHDNVSYPSNLISFAKSIGQAEGYGVAGAIPTLYNNPGDLKIGDIGFGIGPTGITKFDTPDHGWSALYKQLEKIADGTTRAGYTLDMSFSDMANKWAEGDQNWANNVSAGLGTSSSDQIGNYL